MDVLQLDTPPAGHRPTTVLGGGIRKRALSQIADISQPPLQPDPLIGRPRDLRGLDRRVTSTSSSEASTS